MLDTIQLADVLDMASNEALLRGLDTDGDGWTVRGALATKRKSPHYPALVDSIRRDGITTPVLIETRCGTQYLVEGHHRVTAAHDLDLTAMPYTSDRALADRIDRMPVKLPLDGTLTEEAVEILARDAGAGLALALHDATGWPMVEVGYCDELPMHHMVHHPDGYLVDARGGHAPGDVADEWAFDADGGTATLASVAREAVWACYRDEAGEPVPMDVVRAFAPAVLATLTA